MTDKEIIIDGVNVAECNKLYEHIEDDEILKYCKKENDTCEGYDCLLKQLAREKQKNEELTKLLSQEKEDCASACPNVQLLDKYSQALIDIRDMCRSCFEYSQIENKINEVLGDENN